MDSGTITFTPRPGTPIKKAIEEAINIPLEREI